MKRLLVFWMTVLLVGQYGLSQNVLATEDVNSKIQRVLREERFKGVVLLAQKNRILFGRGYGFADRQRRIPNSLDTVFDIGSITKPITALGVVKCQELGWLSVKDSLAKFFPDVPNDKRNITIEQLLTHTAGFPDEVGGDYERVTKGEFLGKAFAAPLEFVPGSKYQYSNVGFSLAGIIIEKVSGESYESFLQRYIFHPAEMTQTGYKLPLWEYDKIAVGYDDLGVYGNPIFGRPNEKPWDIDGPYWHLKANGGLLSTAIDMHKLYRALKTNKILTRENQKIVFKKYISENERNEMFRGLGWGILDVDGQRIALHNGSNGVFFADYYFTLRNPNLVLFIATNSVRENYPELAQKIFDAVSN